jgi:membrane protein DedA with SNARE-associated domain
LITFAKLTDTVLEFVRQHPNGAAFVVFTLAFGESLPFVSLILPFWVMLVGVGTLIGAANPVIFGTIVTAAATGAALGDWLSYWLGYHCREDVQRMWPLKNYPKLLDRGRAFFNRWGAWAIVLARFSGPLRASVPIVAGIAGMPLLTFQIANWLSAVLWAFALLAPGTWGGKWLLQYVS